MSLIIFVYICICFFVIVFSLLQQNQSGGMGVLGGSSDTLLGTQQVSFLSKVVTFFAILYFSCSFFLNIISSSQTPVFTPQTPKEKPSTELKLETAPESQKESQKKQNEEKKLQNDRKNSDENSQKNKKESQ